MKTRNVLYIALSALITAPIAIAQADVTVYGKLHGSIDFTDNGGNTNDTATQFSSNSSRLGFKGSEDIGNGLKTVWQIESAVNLTDNNPTGGAFELGSRNTFLGLAGDFGTAVIGRHDTPYKISTATLDPFSDTIADYNAIMGNTGGAAGFDARPGNVLAYISPDFNGFSGILAYVSDLNPGNDVAGGVNPNDVDAWSVMGKYTNGPIFVTAAYETHNNIGTVDQDAWKLGGSYKYQDLTVGLAYENIDLAGATGDRDGWLLSAQYDFAGNNALKFAYAGADNFNKVKDSGADHWALGVSHKFSKRTEAYALYSATSNDTFGTYGLGQGGYGSAVAGIANKDSSAFGFGLIHSF